LAAKPTFKHHTLPSLLTGRTSAPLVGASIYNGVSLNWRATGECPASELHS